MASTLNYQNPDEARRETAASWWRKIAGTPHREVWEAFAREADATFIDKGWLRGASVVALAGPWRLTLDLYSESHGESHQTYTRMRAPFVNPGGFRFRVYRKTIFSDLGKFLFGTQDIVVGDAAFDEAFVIQGDDERRVKALLADDRLRWLIGLHPHVLFQVKDDEGYFGAHFPQGVDELHFITPGAVKDLDRLHDMFALFDATLRRLCELGLASDRSAPVDL